MIYLKWLLLVHFTLLHLFLFKTSNTPRRYPPFSHLPRLADINLPARWFSKSRMALVSRHPIEGGASILNPRTTVLGDRAKSPNQLARINCTFTTRLRPLAPIIKSHIYAWQSRAQLHVIFAAGARSVFVYFPSREYFRSRAQYHSCSGTLRYMPDHCNRSAADFVVRYEYYRVPLAMFVKFRMKESFCARARR